MNFRVPGIELGPNIRPVAEISADNVSNSVTTTHNTEQENVRSNVNNVIAVTDVINDINLSSDNENTENREILTLTTARNLLTVNTTNVNSTLNDINVTSSLTNVRNALNSIVTSDIDISNWDALPSTSRETDAKISNKIESKSVAKICGQNVCLDDSIFKRTSRNTDDEFFAELDRISDSVEGDNFSYTQRLSINNENTERSERYVFYCL